jgi:hypothetical protein
MQPNVSLFSSGLEGWRMAGSGWFKPLADGIVESHCGPGILWYAGRSFGDFMLRVEWKLNSLMDNSGIFLRAPPLDDSPEPAIENGYEIQIDDRGFDPQSRTFGSPIHLTGAIYRLAPAELRCSETIGTWNLFEVLVQGPSIRVTLNGQRVSHLENATRRREGHIGLQCHHAGSSVQFRNLEISPL